MHWQKLQNSHIWAAIALLLVFLGMIFGSALFSVIEEPRTVSVQENRRLAKKPAFSWRAFADGSYQQKFDQFVSDHFGLREQILGAGSHYRRLLFNKSNSRHVYHGKDDWLFMNIDGALYDFIGRYTTNPQGFESAIQALSDKSDWLAKLGSHYLLVPIPGKMSVYPEYLPKRIQEVAGITRLQLFMQRLEGNTVSSAVLDTRPIMEKAKQQRTLFFKTDTHWNDDGAYAIYRETIEHLQQRFPQLQPLAPEQLNRSSKLKKGDIGLASGYGLDYREPSTSLDVTHPCANPENRNVEGFVETAAYRTRPKALPVFNGCHSKSLKALIVHDSFGAYLQRYFNETFNQVVYMPSYDVFGMKEFIEQYQPDVYIDFRAERRFHLLLNQDPRIQSDLQN